MSQPLVVFPDAVALVVGVLDAVLGVAGVTKVPNPRPDEFVLVRRVGGPRANLVTDNATLTVEAYAATEAAAHDLLQLARAHIHALRGTSHDGVAVYRIGEFAGPASLPDPLTDQERFTMTMTVAVRGATPVGS